MSNPKPCQDDSCELVHCRKCRCHTVGNELHWGGYCFDCWAIDAEEQNQLQEKGVNA